MNQHVQGLPEIRLRLADARADLRTAKDTLELARAEAEQQAIDQANGSIGKNSEDRARALTIALARNAGYQRVLHIYRRCEAEVERLDALLEGARDARRHDEWTVRARLAEALERAGVQSDDRDPQGDAAFDDAADDMFRTHQRMKHAQAKRERSDLYDYDQEGVRF